MMGISTHVLDIAQGQPAQDVPVRLERQEAALADVRATLGRYDDGRHLHLGAPVVVAVAMKVR
jgi:5-hydroxyisourate hydrolase-like protein (transthyretin family)